MRDFIERYQHHISAASLAGGFIIDSLTLRRVDLLPETILLYSYLGIAAFCILLTHLFENSEARGGVGARVMPWLTFALQFTYGGLFSAFLIFYSRSASLITSWPFLLLLLLVFIGTEVFKQYNSRLVFQLAVFFFGVFSFCVFAVPIAVGSIGPWVFILSGVLSLVIFSVFVYVLRVFGRGRIRDRIPLIIFLTGCIFSIINLLYFFNVLPPIPLALKEIGIYHSVTHTGSSYILTQEHRAWYDLSRPVLHRTKEAPLYVFAAVFAPVSLKTDVVHRWQYYDDAGGWADSTTIKFPMVGGREQGFRGYSVKYGATPGWWRVLVETPNGQLIGNITFFVEIVNTPPVLETVSH